MSRDNRQLDERSVLLAKQKHHLNVVNRMIWLLIQKAGGEVRIPKKLMSEMPDGWQLHINSDDETNEVIFLATEKDKEFPTGRVT